MPDLTDDPALATLDEIDQLAHQRITALGGVGFLELRDGVGDVELATVDDFVGLLQRADRLLGKPVAPKADGIDPATAAKRAAS